MLIRPSRVPPRRDLPSNSVCAFTLFETVSHYLKRVSVKVVRDKKAHYASACALCGVLCC